VLVAVVLGVKLATALLVAVVLVLLLLVVELFLLPLLAVVAVVSVRGGATPKNAAAPPITLTGNANISMFLFFIM
jgi:type IV secretory pathway VirB3-like protein